MNGTDLTFEEIYTEHYPRVRSLCFRMLRNDADAEDLAQVTFMQVFRKLHTFKGDSKLTTWLHRVAVNQVLMHMRERKAKFTFESIEDPDLAKAVTQIRERPVNEVDRIALNDCIRQLPRGYKNSILLRDVFGYEHEEVGTISGLSAGTSKSQQHKARLKMQKLLKTHTNPTIYQGAMA